MLSKLAEVLCYFYKHTAVKPSVMLSELAEALYYFNKHTAVKPSVMLSEPKSKKQTNKQTKLPSLNQLTNQPSKPNQTKTNVGEMLTFVHLVLPSSELWYVLSHLHMTDKLPLLDYALNICTHIWQADKAVQRQWRTGSTFESWIVQEAVGKMDKQITIMRGNATCDVKRDTYNHVRVKAIIEVLLKGRYFYCYSCIVILNTQFMSCSFKQ